MNGLIFFLFLIFFVFPILKNISKTTKKTKSKSKYQVIAEKLQQEARQRMEQGGHDGTRRRKHQQLHKNDGSDVFPDEHLEHVQARDRRDRQEYRKMEATIHGKKNRAMTKVANKSRTDWGTRGDSGLTSSRGIMIFVLLLALVYFIILAFFPGLISGKT
jgi:hypothetical protein